jgi:hypothetical protein
MAFHTRELYESAQRPPAARGAHQRGNGVHDPGIIDLPESMRKRTGSSGQNTITTRNSSSGTTPPTYNVDCQPQVGMSQFARTPTTNDPMTKIAPAQLTNNERIRCGEYLRT